MKFPIDLSQYKPVKLDLKQGSLSEEQRAMLKSNIQLMRDAIVFFTSYSAKKGTGGHTGGAYDIVPEVAIAESIMQGDNDVWPVHFDEAGHRVAIQYLMAVLHGDLPPEQLLKYREHKGKLPGHPEQDMTPGVKFSSGRLGHLWAHVNGLALAHPDKRFLLLGSDGAQQEGNDAEAARFAVAHKLNVKLLLDNNDVTIAGHPSEYMTGYDLGKTLEGHGLVTDEGDPEDIDSLYGRMRAALLEKGPVALINTRKMAPGIKGIEGMPKGHDAVSPDVGIEYLKARGHSEAAKMIAEAEKISYPEEFLGSSKETKKNRSEFGKIIVDIMDGLGEDGRKAVLVIDNDLEESTGIAAIREAFPDRYIKGGIMERNNFTTAAGFGSEKGRQGIFATFSAFLEMVVSEITMARLNESNVLAHFSHAGIDEMADNTCHYGINLFFADNGLEPEKKTRLYFPAEAVQMRAMLKSIFPQEGLRFVFSTRSATPAILKEDGNPFYDDDYEFLKDHDEVIREGKQGYIVAYGEMLYRALDAVERLKKEGIDVGLINKPTLNVVDEAMMVRLKEAPFVLVVETQNEGTGLGIRFGTWLAERGFKGKYAHKGTTKPGEGGLREHIPFQGLDPKGIMATVRGLL